MSSAWTAAADDPKLRRILCGRAWEGKLPAPEELSAYAELRWPETDTARAAMVETQKQVCADVLAEQQARGREAQRPEPGPTGGP